MQMENKMKSYIEKWIELNSELLSHIKWIKNLEMSLKIRKDDLKAVKEKIKELEEEFRKEFGIDIKEAIEKFVSE